MVGTFPGSHFKLAGIRSAIPVKLFEPIPMSPVDHPVLDIVPTSPGGLCKTLLPGELVGIIEPQHGLGLHPPALIAVHQPVRAGLVGQAAIRLQPILKTADAIRIAVSRTCSSNAGSACTSAASHKQPTALDIVPKGNIVQKGIPLVIKKELEMTGRMIYDMLLESFDQGPVLRFKSGILPDP